MRLRYWTALTVILGVTLTIALRQDDPATQADPLTAQAALPAPGQEGAAGTQTTPDTSAAPATAEATADAASETTAADPAPDDLPRPEDVTYSRILGPGENLSVLLAEAGLDAPVRLEVSDAIGSAYNLQGLKPGYRLELATLADGATRTATLEVENGQRIHAVFGAIPSVRVIPPALDTIHRAGETRIGSSIYAALDAAGIPTRFATDLELVLAGTLDLRRALSGGEDLRIMWREFHLDDRVIGDPTIDYAALTLNGDLYEILWPHDASRITRIYKNKTLDLVFEQPINGARLSSSFGQRAHPIHGNMRMHRGVDFAAPEGAEVLATRDGRITFVGRRGGYGLMVEIAHGRDISTLYAHLSSVVDTLQVGQRIASGDKIGRVGSTGTSTAPHLHYEVIIKDRPIPPLTEGRRPEGAAAMARLGDAPDLIDTARSRLERKLATQSAKAPDLTD